MRVRIRGGNHLHSSIFWYLAKANKNIQNGNNGASIASVKITQIAARRQSSKST